MCGVRVRCACVVCVCGVHVRCECGVVCMCGVRVVWCVLAALTCGLPQGVGHLHGLHLKRVLTVLGKHATHCVQHNLGLGQVGGCALDEHVLGGD